jgi:undecaprenyl pyrophosphate phosphatase UppP
MGDLSPDMPIGTLLVGVATAAVFGLLAIHGLMRWLASAGFAAFFAYRAALALLILLVPALS